MNVRPNLPANSRAVAIQPVEAEAAPIWLIRFLILNIAVTTYADGELRLRAVLCLPLLAIVFVRSFGEGRRINTLRLGQAIVFFWALLALWSVAATVGNHGSLWRLVRELVERHLTSFTAMMAIIFCAKGRYRRHIAAAIVLIFAISAFVGVMQWLNFSWAYRVKSLISVSELAGADIGEAEGGRDLISGLSSNAYRMGYTMAIGTSMLLAMMLEGTTLRRAVTTAQFLAMLTAMLVLQQRSAVVAFALCAVAFMVKAGQSMRGRVVRTMALFLLVAMSGYGVMRWVSHRAEAGARYELTRYDRFWIDESRLRAVESALEMAKDHPLFGVAREEFVERSMVGAAITPHNLFFNALLLLGVPGLLITVTLVVLQLELCRRVWKFAWPRQDFTAVACVMGMIAYLVQCQLHNPSLLNGDGNGWWLTGLLIAALQEYQNETPPRPNNARLAGVRVEPPPGRREAT